jgi:hypothetical protein
MSKTLFRPLTTEELRTYGIKIDVQEYKNIRKHVTDYYPGEAAKILVIVNSEYNDEGYDNKIQSIIVYDNKANIVNPITGKEVQAIKNLPTDLPYNEYDCNEMEDFVLFLKQPELYIKIDDE